LNKFISHYINKYKTFIEFELKNHKKYSKTLQIVHKSFAEQTYKRLILIFENKVINLIYDTRDDLIPEFKYTNDCR